MAAFTDLDDLAVNMTGGSAGAPENVWFSKRMPSSAVSQNSPWRDTWVSKGIPSSGSIPTTPTAPTSATTGAIPFTNASGGREKFLVQAHAFQSSTPHSGLMLYDRLLHMGNLSNNTTSEQTIGGSITRNTGGLGNEAWIYVESGSVTTAKNVTMTYTNHAGTGSQTSVLEIGNTVTTAAVMYRMPLAAGDLGVRSVESIQLSNSTGTATLAVIIARPLLMFGARGKPLVEPPWPKIDDNACLALAYRTTGLGVVTGCLMMAER